MRCKDIMTISMIVTMIMLKRYLQVLFRFVNVHFHPNNLIQLGIADVNVRRQFGGPRPTSTDDRDIDNDNNDNDDANAAVVTGN